ncbi:MAG TPA: 3-hydroxyacyl-CoA dehydrogenase family protein [Chitinophagaceae bacterium]|nr:3-hydroxyacyl-CoA dehydrogenase family protein [Chitinophagaceae bacterium]
MKITVITDDILKEELLSHGLQDDAEINWVSTPEEAVDATICIDLLFVPNSDRIKILQGPNTELVIVNAVTPSLKELPENFVRLNGWRSFLKRNIAEAAANDTGKAKTEKIFAYFNKQIEWVPDAPGFVTARVISMIINEAYFTLEEKVSSKDEIDIAMKLGTNYPYGPFEWSKLIGLKNIDELLLKMAETNSHYSPSALLQQEAITG